MKSFKKFAKLVSVILLVSMLLTSNSVAAWADSLEGTEPVSQTDLQENPNGEKTAETSPALEPAQEQAESAPEEVVSTAEQDSRDAADNEGNETPAEDEQSDVTLPGNPSPEDNVEDQEDESGKLPDVDPEDGEGTENKDPLPERSVRTNYNAIASNAAVQVRAVFDSAEAVPDSAVLTVNEVTAGATYNYAAYMEALGNPENTHLYDLAFLTEETDENGNTTGRSLECQPSAGSVHVTMAFPADSLTERVQVTHLPLTAEVRASVLTTADAVSITADQIHPEAVRDLNVNAAGGTIAFTVDSFSVYAVTAKDEGSQGTENNPGNSGDEGIVESTEDPVEISADQVMVTAADEALIRQAAEALGLKNTDAAQKALPGPGRRQVEGAKASLPAAEEKPHATRSGYVGLDISVDKSLLSEGTLYKVPVTLPDPIDLTGAENAIIDSLTVTVYHIVDGTAEEVECVWPDDVKGTGILSEFFILTDGFSPYIVSYTVEFHNGDTEVVIEGGTQILLSTLITKLGLTRDDGSSFTADAIESVEFTTSGLFTVEEVTGGGAGVVLNRGTEQEETVTVNTGHDFILSSQNPFDEVQMKLIFKDGTTLEVHVTDEQDALTVNVSLYDYDDATAIGFPSDFGGNDNVYVFVWDDSSDQDIKDLSDNTPWACINITDVKGGNSPYSINVDSFNTAPWGGNPQTYSSLSDSQKNNLKVRVVHTAENNLTLGQLKQMAQWQQAAFEEMWNGGFDGYEISSAHRTGLISEGNYEVNFIKGNTRQIIVRMEYEGVTSKATSGKYYVLLDATSQDGNNHYYQVVPVNIDSAGKSTIDLPIGDAWSDNQKFSNNWQGITAKIITPNPGHSITPGGTRPNENDYIAAYEVTGYSCAYQGRKTETDTDNHIQYDEFLFKLTEASYDENAITPYDVLGEGAEFGIIANRYEQTGHTETNMAVNSYTSDSNIDLDGAGDAVMPFYVGAVDEGKQLWISDKTKVGVDLYITQDINDNHLNLTTTKPHSEIIKTQEEINSYVNGLIGIASDNSAVMASRTTVKPALSGNRKTLDLTQFPDNTTIYVDCSDMVDVVATSGWVIEKRPGQSIVFNVPGAGTVKIGEFTVRTKDADGNVVVEVQSTTSALDGDPARNKLVDDVILEHITFNAYEASGLETHNASALFLAPNATKVTQENGAGWIATGGTVESKTEWHFYRHQRRYKSQGDFSLSGTKKIMNGATEMDYSKFSSLTFTFDLFACDENGRVAENAMPLDTVTADSSGNFDFSKLSYTQADVPEGQSSTFYYVIRERVPEGGKAGGVSYDAAPVIVKVVASDDGHGIISFTISTSNDGGVSWTEVSPTPGGSIPVYDIGNFTNTYTSSSTSVNFGGTKTFTGWPTDVTPAPTFTYTLSENGAVLQTKTTQGAGAITFDAITYNEVGTHTYTVAETAGSAAGVTYATNSYTVTVEVYDDGTGQLKTNIDGEYQALNFVNTYTPLPTTVTFEGMKTLTGKQLRNAEFSFTLTGTDDGVNQVVSNDGTGKISFAAINYTKAGTYRYTVKENATQENGVTIDNKVYNLTVTVTDDGSGQLKATVSGDSTTGKDLSFANKYEAGSTSVNFGGQKTFNGWPADVTPAPTFTYTLSEGGSVIDTQTTQGAGPYNFRSITYDTVGTHTYTVVETKGSAKGVTYDTKTYTVTVEVTDDGSGTLKTKVTGTPAALDFTNSYKADSTSVQFEGMKTLNGKALKDAEFSFTLTGSDGTDETVRNDGEGKIRFSEIKYEKAGTYTYTVRENATDEAGVTIDSKVYNITVTVTDDGSGKLAAEVTGANEKGLNFSNTYEAGSTSVNFGGNKTFNGWPTDVTPAPIFTYTLSEGKTVLQTVSTQGAGAISFNSITYDKVGTHTYTVKETVGNAKGVTYDTKTYTVTVEVTDDGSGTLKTKVTGTPAALDFTNSYKADSTSVQFEGMKTLTGKELKDAEFSFTLTGSDGTDETVRNDGEGKIRFSEIKYEKAGTYTYTVKENATDEAGVTIDSKVYNITVEVTDDGSGKLAAEVTGANEKGLNFSNTYEAGSTSVNFGGTKTFEGWPTDVTTKPTFTYTMSENGEVIDTQTTHGAGDYQFKSITYDEVGTHTYTVVETKGSAKGVTYDTKTYTVTVEVTDDGSGTLKTKVTGTPAALDFTNSYKADSTSVQFEGMKTLNGKALKDAEFSFTLTGSDGTDETVRNDGEGKIRFSEIKYEKAGTYTYTVRENATDEAGVTIDSKVYNITVTVTDDGSGKLAAEVTGANEKGLNFSNTYKAGSTSVNFGGTKTFEGWPTDVTTKPTFTYTMSENGEVIDTQTTHGAGDYQFKSITYDEVGTHTYTVVETKGSAKGVTYDTKTYTVTVEVTDDGSGTLKTKVTGTPEALDFTNSYKAEQTSVQFEGMKTLTGKELKDAEFSFTLTGSDGTDETVRNDGEGKIRFSEIKYEKAGTYTYTVRENATDEAGVTIDSKVYNITVEVTDDGSGKLAAEVTGANEKGLNFSNTYEAGSTSVNFGGTKTFNGWPTDVTPAPTFTYTLSEGETVLQTVSTQGAGAISFNSITYDKVGTHTYTVKETVGNAKGVTYDETTYEVTVEVTDDGSGALKTKVTGTPEALDFTNSYKADSTSVQFEGMKTLTGKELKDAEFSFTLTGSDGTDETVRNDGEGKIRFSEIKYEKAGTYTYTVKENATDEAGVTIDSTTYNITVEVTDDGSGKLAAEVTGANEKGLNFSNTYEAGSTSVNFGGTKTFEGWPTDVTTKPTFTYTMSENGEVIDTQTTHGAGDYQFKSITYDEVGTHTYTVVETKGSAKGVTYDTKTYTVTVEVTDDGSGTLKTKVTGTPEALDFTNSYKADSTSVQFEGLKTLSGKELKDAEFSFTLTGSDGTDETVRNDGEGKIRFSEIKYEKAGTYTYTVRENATDEAGVTIDSTTYNITVTVTDDGSGKLAAEVTGANEKGLNFSNTYEAGSTSVNFGGTKTFEGWPTDVTTKPTFTYTMSENGEVIDTQTTHGAGDYQFKSITYDEVGTHTYTVVETKGSAKGVTYDTKTYTVTVEVTDDGSGTLKTKVTGTPAALDFTNSYKAEQTSVQFEGMKTLNGKALKDAEFSFTLTGSDGTDETVRNDGEGKIRFSEIKYEKAGTYTYTVKENATDEAGVTIDSTTYNITVTVTDDGSGQLAAEVTGADPKQINFVNQYLNGNLTITKMVTGQLGDKNKAFTFTIKLSCEGEFEYDGDVTGTISDGGTIRLKHGQSVTIKGLPAGCEYTVTESGNTGYRVYSTGAVGVIEDKATAIAAFTNSKSRVPATGESNWMLAGLAMMASSSVGMFGIARAKKRKEDEDQVR